jgi:hypothetical protein
MMRFVFFVCVAVLSIGRTAICGDAKIPIKIDTGFFDRQDALIEADVNFGGAVDTKSIKLIGDGKDIPILIVPKGEYKATVYWVLRGETPSMTRKEYTLRFSNGKWSGATTGPEDLRARVLATGNLVPNPSFEKVVDAKQSTNWHGSKTPEGWTLKDYAWHFRKLPEIKSVCRVTDKIAKSGKNSLLFKSELRDEKENGKTINLIGYAVSSIFPLKPDVKYSFSYFIKFTEVKDNGRKYQGISASVNFLDENKKRIFPRNYGLNRLQNAYSTMRHPKKDFFNKWTKTTYVKKTPSEVRYGQIWISGDFTGTVYLDDFTLKELSKGGKPVKVEVGERVNCD